MAKKQKQKSRQNKEGRNKTQKQDSKNKNNDLKTNDVGTRNNFSKPVIQIPRTLQTRLPRKRNFSVLGTIYLIMMFGALFAMMTAFSLLFDLSDSSIAQYVQKVTQTDGDDLEPVIINNKIEALNGVLYEPDTMFYPIAIMFDNHSLARPHSHLQSASVVYETLVEGSITRFMGLFDHGDLDKVGPIRSARPYFVQWTDAVDAAYMHAGGSPEALQKIGEYGIKNIAAGQYYYRDYSRPGPHNLYTNSGLMKLALRDYKWADNPQNFSRWEFSDSPKLGTQNDGRNVNLAFSGSAVGSLVRWEYIPESKLYKRVQAGIAHEDTSTNAQLTAKSIVVQTIPSIVSYQDHGRLILNIFGEGRADILFDGKRIQGTWKQADVTERTKFYDEAGEEVVFPRGNVFVEVIPSDREVTFE